MYEYDSDIAKNMLNYLKLAFAAKYKRVPNSKTVYGTSDILKLIVTDIADEKFEYLELDKKFGEGTAEDLHIKAQKQVKFQNFELLEMIKYYQNKFDELK